MTVDVKLFDDLQSVAADAGGALDRERQASPYDRLEWFERTQAHCPPAGTPLIARARNGKGAAWLFLSRQGSKAEALSSWYTQEYDVVESGEAASLVETLARGLKGISRVTMLPVAEPDALLAGFRKAGWFAWKTPHTVNWRIRPPASFAQFWEERPGKLRSTVKRKEKKAALDIAIHRDFDPTAWEAYRAIYLQSWKPEEGSWDFMRAWAEAEGAAGTLRLGIASQAGVPIAAQLWTVEHGRATIHKLAYAESAKELSPGSILSAAMFRHVIEADAPALIDYGTGDEPYKADWMAEKVPLWRIDCYHPARPAAWPALARHALSLVRRRAKD